MPIIPLPCIACKPPGDSTLTSASIRTAMSSLPFRRYRRKGNDDIAVRIDADVNVLSAAGLVAMHGKGIIGIRHKGGLPRRSHGQQDVGGGLTRGASSQQYP